MQIDARGQLCPKPLIMTRKALDSAGTDTSFEVLVDNETSRTNIERYLTDNHIPFSTEERSGVWTIHVRSTGKTPSEPAENWCPTCAPATAPQGALAIAITSEFMGNGDDALGTILLKAFINTISELQPLPATIVFYNSGIKMALTGSPVIESLRSLEQKGLRILVCGTCLNYYQATDQLGVGVVSNMYEIMDQLAQAARIIRP